MFLPDQYALIDFGGGRKLERFGQFVLDRPAPGARGRPALPEAWSEATARYERHSAGRGQWVPPDALPQAWTVRSRIGVFYLKPTPFGHVGLFPEHAETWHWIDQQIRHAARPLSILHLFAYTGGATMAAARAGAEVTHVDAARNVVRWARQNAEASGLGDAPIRWICEDARKFVDRQLRRGRSYDAVILDPPTYGHGPRGQPWKVQKHLPELLRACGRLTGDRLAFALLTCHWPGFQPDDLRRMLTEQIDVVKPRDVQCGRMVLRTADGRTLPVGVMARWSAAGVRQNE